MKYFLRTISTVLIASTSFSLSAQAVVLDKIVAKVGNEFVLHSEVEEQYAMWAESGGGAG
jgi:hypothetical protein